MYINKEARKNGVKAPEVLYSNKKHNITVYERIEGEILSRLSDRRKIDVTDEIVRQLKNFHSGSYEGFGEITDFDNIIGEYPDYKSFFEAKMEKALNIPDGSRFKEHALECRNISQSIEVPNRQESNILHADINGGNVLVEDGDMYLIDYENAFLGLSEYEWLKAYIKTRRNIGKDVADALAESTNFRLEDTRDSTICMFTINQCLSGNWREQNDIQYGLDKREKDIQELLELVN